MFALLLIFFYFRFFFSSDQNISKRRPNKNPGARVRSQRFRLQNKRLRESCLEAPLETKWIGEHPLEK